MASIDLHSRFLPSVMGLLVLGAPIPSGCSVAEYDKAYVKRVAEYRDSAGFAALDKEPAALGGLMTLRFPHGFERIVGNLEGPAANGIRPEWLGGFGEIQAMCFGSDGTPEAKAGLVMFVVTSLEKPSVLEEKLEARLRRQADPQNVVFTWESEEVSPVAGGPVVWRSMTTTREEKLPSVDSPGRGPSKLAADCCFWVSADRDQPLTVGLIWLTPRGVTSIFGLSPNQLQKLVARTVRIDATVLEEGNEEGPL
jgi:hypothetical protein